PVVARAACAVGGGGLVEAAAAAAVGGARQVVAPYVARERDVVFRIRAHPGGRHLQREHFRAAERFDDFRAGIGELAAIEDAARMDVARAIREAVPPLRAFASHLVELEHAVGHAPA